jgi:8-hydroxy-5-deazaflavin:NADPH oxidoreductase
VLYSRSLLKYATRRVQIAIIGRGNVGGTLGRRFVEAGHQVVFGVRDPDGAAGTATVTDAVKQAEVVLLATPWPAAKDAIQSAGSLEGKILVDATNPIGAGFKLEQDPSGAERVAQWAKGARVVKCFNQVGFDVMENPRFGDRRSVLFAAGDDAKAKETVIGLANAIGFDCHDGGPLANAALLENFAMLWIKLAMQLGFGREWAFGVLKR